MGSDWIKQTLWLSILFYLANQIRIVVSFRHCGEFDGNSTTQQKIFGFDKSIGFESMLEQLFDGFNQKNAIKMNRAMEMLQNVEIDESAELPNHLMKTIVRKMIKKFKMNSS